MTRKTSMLLRTMCIIFALCQSVSASAVNPFLPLWEYIPDGEPYVFDDPDNPGRKRVYVYGSHDSMRTEYCGRELVVWSASLGNLDEWRYDGVIFESKTDANGEWLNPDGIGDVLYAPDVVEAVDKNGKKTYYLYPNNQAGGRNGMVAKSDRPDGPFVVCNWSKESPKKTDGILGFDPAVFIDDDGKVYGYWGFEKSWGAELDPATMATVKEGTQIVEDMVSNKDQDGIFRFFEASSIRKIKDKYVFIYSRWTNDSEFGLPNTNYTLAYAYADKPLGPYTYGGTIIDGRGRDTDINGNTIHTATASGNTHGSIFEVNGQWFVVYHRQTGLTEYSRQAMVAPINVYVSGDKVIISEGEYTSEGFEIYGLDPFKRYSAGIACHYTGPQPSTHAWPNMQFSGSYVKPTYLDGKTYVNPYDLKVSSNPVVNNTNGSVIGYKYFNFDSTYGSRGLKLSMTILPQGVDGKIEIYIGNPKKHGEKIGEIEIKKEMKQELTELETKVSALKQYRGKRPLFFAITSDTPDTSICEIHDFGFTK